MPVSDSQALELIVELTALQNKIQKQLDGVLFAHGISFTEFIVLLQLIEAPGNKMRRIDLAQKVGLSASGVTRLLNPMQKIGLVQKEATARDARVSLVALSAAGKRTFDEAGTSFDQAAEALFSPIDGQGKGALSQLVKALL